MSDPYPHAEGSHHPHQSEYQQHQQQQQQQQPQQQPIPESHDLYRHSQRVRPPAIQLPHNPYQPHFPLAHHAQFAHHPQSPQEHQGYYPPPPPPNIFYAAENQPPGPPVGMSFSHPQALSVQGGAGTEIPSVLLPQSNTLPLSYVQQQQQQVQLQLQQRHPPQPVLSPYENVFQIPLGTGSSHNGVMSEYFPPLQTPSGLPDGVGSSHNEVRNEYFSAPVIGSTGQTNPNFQQPLPSPSLVSNWQSNIPQPNHPSHSRAITIASTAGGKGSGSNEQSHGSKTTRQQFTACGACRHRRVKCDLKDKQEAAEQSNQEDHDRGMGPTRGKPSGKTKKVSCTNCIERGLNCIDEFAPLKAAKQLRRGKRISEIEMLFGKSAANAAMAHQHLGEGSDSSVSPTKGKDKEDTVTPDLTVIPDLTKEFFESAFFRRFQVQRPIIDPQNFIARYLSNPVPTAAAMGLEGAILCHVLYAWAVSYGVDEHGHLDVEEGGGAPLEAINLVGPSDGEIKREADRHRRRSKMRFAIEIILKEIDECGILRKPTWDGVRVLLLVLPLTDGFASPVERLAMYEGAISQVFTLCSFTAMGYDGQPSGTASVNGGTDDMNGQDLAIVRVRVYWYAFVHEGITTGLKGGRLHLDDEDLDTMQDSINHRALVRDSSAFRVSSQFATAPINLALACRKINKALTGPAAKRRTGVNGNLVKEAWEALERCWEDFDQLKYNASSGPSYAQGDEVIRFADGWKIFLFEAQNVIRANLEDRLAKLSAAQTTAFITDSNPSTPEAMHNDLVNAQHLLDIAKDKCEVKTRQIMDIVRNHVGTRFFEWDASLVRDGTYYTAMLLARSGGSDEDIQICIRALNELRWAHAKAWDRSADLRREWQERAPTLAMYSGAQPEDWEAVLSDLAKLSSQNNHQQDDQAGVNSDTQSRSTDSSHSQHQHAHQQQLLHSHHRSETQSQGQQLQQPQRHAHQLQHHEHAVSQHQHLHGIHRNHYHAASDPAPSSESPYTSPPITSPAFDPTSTLAMPLMRGYIPQPQTFMTTNSNPAQSSRPIASQLDMLAEVDGELTLDSKAGIIDMEINATYPKWMEPRHHQHHHEHEHHHLHTHAYNSHASGSGAEARASNTVYPVYVTPQHAYPAHQQHLGPPPLGSNPMHTMGVDGNSQGTFVLQQDGTHVFVPYTSM